MPRILLVDDSALVRNSMHNVLEPYGVELAHAENGQIAVEKAMSSEWDLIFLDVVMPVMDGPTALREIRARGNTTPVVLVTSVSTAVVVAGAVKLGGVQYIGKPFTPDQIRSVATRMLRLDHSALTSPPRVLLQHADPELPSRLAKRLPPHVVIDASHSLAQSLDLAEHHRHGLVLVESRDPVEELRAIASVLRREAPNAGVFAITDEAEGTPPWNPDDDLDGLLPRTLDDPLVRGFLYGNFLRPLVFVDGRTVQAAGFQGQPAQLSTYLTMVTRTVLERCARIDQTLDPHVDLRNVPANPEAVVGLVTELDAALRGAGTAPAFRLSADMRAEIASRLPDVLMT